MDEHFKITPEQFEILLSSLRRRDYRTIGPRRIEDAITYDVIESIVDFPKGWSDEQTPGRYRITRRGDDAYFGYTLPPQSWKRFLYPPSRKLFAVKRNGKTLELDSEKRQPEKYAFIGVRACELSAIEIQDKVFSSGEYRDEDYITLRRNSFIVAVNCSQAGENCFCKSMNTGPGSKTGFDIALTEVISGGEHYFVAEAGTERGFELLREIKAKVAIDSEIASAQNVVERTAEQIEKRLETDGLAKLLAENLEHPHWDDVAKRCLTCGNCTMVCPTCFCSTVEDSTDLAGQSAARTRRWDSCFTLDFAKVSGGNFRTSPRSRYRQWLTHKLSSWVEQFGVSGCVGCGRCITWCPVGIDLTSEVKTITGASIKQQNGVL